ncbi:MAG: hypothetical protein GF368_01785 [Candidatus Aenigmarchaeota archaeon]|nr:hypothetical protein [Candidatus Aenigmarchaeota archaeon]
MMTYNFDDESFDTNREHEISRIINNHSDKIYTYKNYDDMYDYDLIVKDKELDMFLGYIEVEVSNYEFLGGRNWYHSFLKRKVLKFCDDCFIDELKDNALKTIYIKFNKNFGLDDCICCDMKTISRLPSDYQNKTNSNYRNCLFRTTIDDKRIKVGINECIKYIEDYLLFFRVVN